MHNQTINTQTHIIPGGCLQGLLGGGSGAAAQLRRRAGPDESHCRNVAQAGQCTRP